MSKRRLVKTKNIKSVLAVDPGLSCMGWAFGYINLNTGYLTILEHGVIHPDKLSRKDKTVYGLFEDRVLRIHVVRREYSKLVNKFNADYHASESAFFHPRSPQAFAALSICIYTLVGVLYNRFRAGVISLEQATLHRYAPRQIKRVTSSDGTSNKDKMQFSIMNNKNIKFLKEPEKPLTEHEADAIGCAYTFGKLEIPQMLSTVRK